MIEIAKIAEVTPSINLVLPTPHCGNMVIEIIKEDSTEYKKKMYGMENSVLALPDMVDAYVPVKKGKILSMATDCYGERYVSRYGKDGIHPEVGDTVMFIPNQSYRIDAENKYHIIADEHVIAYYKAEVQNG